MSKISKTKAKKQAAAPAPAKERTKTGQVLALLNRASGASIAEVMKVTGWQAHSVRGFFAGTLKKKGHSVSSTTDEKGERRYRIVAAGAMS